MNKHEYEELVENTIVDNIVDGVHELTAGLSNNLYGKMLRKLHEDYNDYYIVERYKVCRHYGLCGRCPLFENGNNNCDVACEKNFDIIDKYLKEHGGK